MMEDLLLSMQHPSERKRRLRNKRSRRMKKRDSIERERKKE
jgi:hypothetical protein